MIKTQPERETHQMESHQKELKDLNYAYKQKANDLNTKESPTPVEIHQHFANSS